MTVGVTVDVVESPPSAVITATTQNVFMPVLADWGPVGTPMTATSLASVVNQIGTPSGAPSVYGGRTSTCATAVDAADAILNEAQNATPVIYMSRVVGSATVAASLVLQDATPVTSITVTAKYVGAGGNGIYVQVDNTGTAASIALLDASGNTLAQSTSETTVAALVTWLNTTSLVTAAAGTGNLPVTITATALAGGTDDRSAITLSDVTAALDTFGPNLGPGQVIAPGWTDTTLSGIWSALASHGQANNRVAICDTDDDTAATQIVSDVSGFGTSAVASYAGFWAGNRQIPGVVPNTSRSVAPSPVIAGLCARADQAGNPNQAPGGINWPLVYATQPTSLVSGAPNDTYSMADLQTLNAASVNTFQRIDGTPTNYGFVASVPPSVDGVFWQLSHSRLRMFISQQAAQIGQQYMFAQLDGQGAMQNQFATALDGLLMRPLWTAGALYGDAAEDAYTIDVGSDVNTPTTIAAGQLNAKITCSFSYFAQSIVIVVNVAPIVNAG